MQSVTSNGVKNALTNYAHHVEFEMNISSLGLFNKRCTDIIGAKEVLLVFGDNSSVYCDFRGGNSGVSFPLRIGVTYYFQSGVGGVNNEDGNIDIYIEALGNGGALANLTDIYYN